MTDRLKNDVIFINVDGCADFTDHSDQTLRDNCLHRLTKVNTIKKHLKQSGLRVYTINPVDGDISYIPFFHREGRDSVYSYSSFILFDLYDVLEKNNIKYSHIVIFQSDGFPTYINQWDDEFLEYDYIGLASFEDIVMNGGFSLRSKRLLKHISELRELKRYETFIEENGHGNEDVVIHEFNYIEKYPPLRVLNKFCMTDPIPESFGFHKETIEFDYATSLWGN